MKEKTESRRTPVEKSDIVDSEKYSNGSVETMCYCEDLLLLLKSIHPFQNVNKSSDGHKIVSTRKQAVFEASFDDNFNIAKMDN